MNDTKETRLLLSGLIAGMCANFGRTMDEAILATYCSALLPLDLKEVKYAFSVVLQRPPQEIARKNWATCADLLRIIETRDGGTVEQRTTQAWAKVCDAIRRVGRYCGAVVFDDPAIHVAICRLGGWVALCHKTQEEFSTWTSKAFASEYATALQYHHAVVPMLRGEPKHKGIAYAGDSVKAKQIALKYGLAKNALPVPASANEPKSIGDIAKTLQLQEGGSK